MSISLEQELEAYRKSLDGANHDIDCMQQELAIYKAALEFYANKTSWMRDPVADIARKITDDDCRSIVWVNKSGA